MQNESSKHAFDDWLYLACFVRIAVFYTFEWVGTFCEAVTPNTWLSINALLTGPCAVVLVGDGWDLQFPLPGNVSCCETMWQKISTAVMAQQCSLPLYILLRSLSKAHLQCSVCSLQMTHPQENELYGAGSLANKQFTVCTLLWSTCWLKVWTHRLQTQPDKPTLFYL